MKLVNLIPLQEIDFSSQKSFDTYNKQHKLRPDTKVKIAGKDTTAGQASKVNGTSVFGDVNPKSISSKVNPIITKIKDLTNQNDHNGAAMQLAKMVGDKSYIEQMQKIQRYHDLKGHMPQSLVKYRTAIVNNLITQVKNKYGSKIAKQLHNSF